MLEDASDTTTNIHSSIHYLFRRLYEGLISKAFRSLRQPELRHDKATHPESPPRQDPID